MSEKYGDPGPEARPTLAAPEANMTASARLGREVLPTAYDLEIETDADATRFRGRVTIDLDVTEPTSTVVLHAKDLDVELIGLRQAGMPRSRQRWPSTPQPSAPPSRPDSPSPLAATRTWPSASARP